MSDLNKHTGLEIAVIGMSARFPGASDLDSFWKDLTNGKERITFFEDKPEDVNYVNSGGGILENKHAFDYDFFDYTLLEAALMDPQMRILHECVWEAIENAGYNTDVYNGAIGMYAGASSGLLWQGIMAFSEEASKMGAFSATHFADKDFAATRIAYKFQLKGPAQVIQTACSTSLVAIHHACRGLLTGDCSMAVAAGVSINPLVETGYRYKEGMILSKDGHCKAWDKDASGTVPGNGAGVVVLKRLKDALRDSDHIYAVIKGSAINNDGNRKIGFTAPSIEGQAEVIRKALKFAQVPSESISYIETHGTGTALGDPIEFEGLKLAFDSSKKGFCGIGSVKTNIGHLDAAAGIASFIKTVLSLYHKKLPPTLHYKSPNKNINFEDSPFYVVDELKDWVHDLRRAGVSSFGIGGTNAHVILEEFVSESKKSLYTSEEDVVLLLSAKSVESLNGYKEKLLEFIRTSDAVDLKCIAYSLQLRKSFNYRCAVVGNSVESIIQGIDRSSFVKNDLNDAAKLVMMFPGQGNNYEEMANDLYTNNEIFRKHLESCFVLSQKYIGDKFDVKKAFLTGGFSSKGIYYGMYSQVLLFSIEFSLAQYLIYLGIIPDLVIGHSLGEIVAATIAGVFSLEDALYILVTRSTLMNTMPEGAMVSVALPEEVLTRYLIQGVDIAVSNTSDLHLIAGLQKDITVVVERLKQDHIPFVLLPVNHAFHSYLTEPILEEFEKSIAHIQFNNTQISMLSTVTGELMSAADSSASYWSNQIREKVQFGKCMDFFEEFPNIVFLEVGPGKSLKGFLDSKQKLKNKSIPLLLPPKYRSEISEHGFLKMQLGRFWEKGGNVIWTKLYKTLPVKLPLPSYVFDKKIIPFNSDFLSNKAEILVNRSKEDRANWFYAPVWKQIHSPNEVSSIDVECITICFLNADSEWSYWDKHVITAEDVIRVFKSQEYSSNNNNVFTISADDETHYIRLFQEIGLAKLELLG